MVILASLLFLILFLWGLVKLKEIRELPAGGLPQDETTLMLGLFYVLSQACIHYHKERGRYPMVIEGARDGLIELGYLNKHSWVKETSILPAFTILVTEESGYGIVVSGMSPHLAREVVDRATRKGASPIIFMDFKEDKFVPLPTPLNVTVNLTLPLPYQPKSGRSK